MASIKKNIEAPSTWKDLLKVTRFARGVPHLMHDTIISDEALGTLASSPLVGRTRSQGLLLKNRATSPKAKVIEDNQDPSLGGAKTTITNPGLSQIEVNRATSNSLKANQEDVILPIETPSLKFSRNNQILAIGIQRNNLLGPGDQSNNPETSLKKLEPPSDIKNVISIVNLIDEPYSKVELQTYPREVEVNPDTTWSTVKTPGRNSPLFNFTGAEDTITLEVSWYSVQDTRRDVISKCRLLESWSKADGYNSSPPLLNIIWGDSGIFDNQQFILYSAKYNLSNFQNAYKDKASNVINLKLLPNTATQTLVFKRVSGGNLLHSDIISPDNLQGIRGVTKT